MSDNANLLDITTSNTLGRFLQYIVAQSAAKD
jgi:hypothetical protein